MIFSIQDFIEGSKARVLQEGTGLGFSGVVHDSRHVHKDEVFIALTGERLDGHSFLKQVVEAGATGLLVQKGHESLKQIKDWPHVTVFEVDDTLEALQAMGAYWRKKLKTRIVAVAGSNGKTSTKNFTAQLLKAKYDVFSTPGNWNNHIGVPLSLLSLRANHQVAVIEIGMNHPGEVARLTQLVQPNAGLITNIGREHLEGLGSIEAVAKANEELFENSSLKSTRIINLDNPHTALMQKNMDPSTPQLTFSSYTSSATVVLKEDLCHIDFIDINGHIAGEPGRARVPVFGRHQVANLMAASCAALAMDVEPDLIWKALPECRGTWGRNQKLEHHTGATVIFDGYNANPESVAALLDNISRLRIQGRRIGIFADMLEMGSDSPLYHREWGELAGNCGFDCVWFYGAQRTAFHEGLQKSGYRKKLYLSDTYEDALASEIQTMLQPNDIVFVKGSRGMKLERVVQSWIPQFGSNH